MLTHKVSMKIFSNSYATDNSVLILKHHPVFLVFLLPLQGKKNASYIDTLREHMWTLQKKLCTWKRFHFLYSCDRHDNWSTSFVTPFLIMEVKRIFLLQNCNTGLRKTDAFVLKKPRVCASQLWGRTTESQEALWKTVTAQRRYVTSCLSAA